MLALAITQRPSKLMVNQPRDSREFWTHCGIPSAMPKKGSSQKILQRQKILRPFHQLQSQLQSRLQSQLHSQRIHSLPRHRPQSQVSRREEKLQNPRIQLPRTQRLRPQRSRRSKQLWVRVARSPWLKSKAHLAWRLFWMDLRCSWRVKNCRTEGAQRILCSRRLWLASFLQLQTKRQQMPTSMTSRKQPPWFGVLTRVPQCLWSIWWRRKAGLDLDYLFLKHDLAGWLVAG